MSAGFVPQKELVSIISVLEPKEGSTTDEILNVILRAQEEYPKIPGLIAYSILKATNGTKVVPYSIYEQGLDLNEVLTSTTSVVAPIWAELESISERSVTQYDTVDLYVNEGATLELVEGLVLTLSLFNTPDTENQEEALSHIRGHLKATAGDIYGLKGGILLKSVDGIKIAILCYWDNEEVILEALQDGRFDTLRTRLADSVSEIQKEVLIVHHIATV
ncbi:hypothetical protein O6H91_18G067100 [Diphasiastrum complanatum]|uniref:Uncharacterized protein n=1 Tax=Diphasiastrum complanatum TaxID=34168 RepID=A0ACC2B2D8_DIPCM|nr:hypothetical protein O6H91_18G067100 [Diphasiastrum complanatum]